MAGISRQVLEGIPPVLEHPLLLLLMGHDAQAVTQEVRSGVKKDAKVKKLSGEKQRGMVAVARKGGTLRMDTTQ